MLKKYFSSIIDKIRNISLFTSSKKKEIKTNKENVEEKYYCGDDTSITERNKIPLKIPLDEQEKLLYKNIDIDLKNKAFFKSRVLFFINKETVDTNHNRYYCPVYAIKDYSKPGNYEEIQLCPNSQHLSNRYLPEFKKFIERFLRDLKSADMIVNVNQDIFIYLNTLYSFIVLFKNNYIIDSQEAQKFFSIFKEIKFIISTTATLASTEISCCSYINIKNRFPFFESKVIEEYYYYAKYYKLIELNTGVKYNIDNLEDNIKQLIYVFNNKYLLNNTETNSIQYAAKHIVKKR